MGALLATAPTAPAAPVPPAAEIAATVTKTAVRSPADLAKLEAWKAQFAPGWIAAKTAEINAQATAVTGLIDARCNGSLALFLLLGRRAGRALRGSAGRACERRRSSR